MKKEIIPKMHLGNRNSHILVNEDVQYAQMLKTTRDYYEGRQHGRKYTSSDWLTTWEKDNES